HRATDFAARNVPLPIRLSSRRDEGQFRRRLGCCRRPAPPRGPLTAQGHPRSIFKRAIECGNVVVAEATAREFALTLEEALQLVVLYAAYEPAAVERAALQWFVRYVEEGKGVSLLRAQCAAAQVA